MVLAVVAATFLACGDGGDSGSDDTPAGPTATVGDESTPTAVAIAEGALAGSSVSLPAGALPAGATIAISETGAPDAFTAVTEAPPASAAMLIEAKAQDGSAISAASKPFSVAIAMNDAPAALTAVDKTGDNLCVFVAGVDGKNTVYRDTALSADLQSKVAKLDTTLFGVFQVVYCGDLEIAGFLEAGTSGSGGEEPSALAGPVAKFFETAAGEYALKAVDSNATGDGTWVNGSEYKVTVTKSGEISWPSAKEPVAVAYDEAKGDTFEAFSHEEYVTIERDGFRVLLQTVPSKSDTIFLTWTKLPVTIPTVAWRFDDKGPTGSEGPLGAEGLGKAVGTFTGKVKYLNPAQGGTAAAVGDAVSVTIAINGSVTASTFGTFAYKEGETSFVQTSSDSGISKTIKWKKPSSSAPTETLEMEFDPDGNWVLGRYTALGTSGNVIYGFDGKD
jgi:hypothetical protein